MPDETNSEHRARLRKTLDILDDVEYGLSDAIDKVIHLKITLQYRLAHVLNEDAAAEQLPFKHGDQLPYHTPPLLLQPTLGEGQNHGTHDPSLQVQDDCDPA